MKLSFVYGAFLLQSVAFAYEPAVNVAPKLGSYDTEVFEIDQLLNDTYRIGDEWGKKAITEDHLNKLPTLKKIVMATGRVGGATGFYLGKFNDKYLVGTNHHVCTSKTACNGSTVRFTKSGAQAKVLSTIGSWSDVDFSLLVVEFSAADAEKMKPYASNFNFKAKIETGLSLITVGYGIANNGARELVGNWDSDCKVFSKTDEFRFMGDPDELNPAPYKAWSFANGCDVSHGDSGSAMVDRKTGVPVGIIWTGRIPKAQKIQNSEYLKDLLETNSPEIWQELSYSVPSSKIGSYLTQVADNDSTLSTEQKATLKALLN